MRKQKQTKIKPSECNWHPTFQLLFCRDHANEIYSEEQKDEIAAAREEGVDISNIDPLYDHYQMEQIWMGMKEGLKLEDFNPNMGWEDMNELRSYNRYVI